jgi:hypothetical protein
MRLTGSYDGPLAPYVEVTVMELGDNAAIGPNNARVVLSWPVTAIDGLIATLQTLKDADRHNRAAYMAKRKSSLETIEVSDTSLITDPEILAKWS